MPVISHFHIAGHQNTKKLEKICQIFLIGHSCGAWHSLFISSQNSDLVNSVIAFSPSCFGPRYLYFQRRGFLKQRRNDIKKISNTELLSSIIFVSPNDIRENHMTLKWLKKIDGVKMIKTLIGGIKYCMNKKIEIR